MNFIFSLLYAPLIFVSLRYFDIQNVSLLIIFIAFLWLIVLRNKKDFSIVFPIFYIVFACIAYFSETFFILKMMPLVISSLFSLLLLLSYVQHKSLILYFAEKFSKYEIGESEKEYIHRSTLFWFFVSLINVFIHLSFLLHSNISFWVFYSSFGWYILFICAGILQFIHRQYIFLKNENV
jgi:hypothetical protein